MAITIKNIPVLEGATAEDFVRSAEKNAVKVTPQLSVTAKKRLQKVLENPVHSDSANSGRDFFIR